MSGDTALPRAAAPRRLFFFDHACLDEARHVKLAPAPTRKIGVAIAADPASSMPAISTFCSSIVRWDDGSLRLYYTALALDLSRIGIGVLQSEDGRTWRRPALGQVTTESFNSPIFFESPLIDGHPEVLPSDNTWVKLFTYRGASNSAYLDGHAVSTNSLSIGWQAFEDRDGSWPPGSRVYWRRQQPWFGD